MHETPTNPSPSRGERCRSLLHFGSAQAASNYIASDLLQGNTVSPGHKAAESGETHVQPVKPGISEAAGNQGTVWAGKALKNHLVPTPCHGRDAPRAGGDPWQVRCQQEGHEAAAQPGMFPLPSKPRGGSDGEQRARSGTAAVLPERGGSASSRRGGSRSGHACPSPGATAMPALSLGTLPLSKGRTRTGATITSPSGGGASGH